MKNLAIIFFLTLPCIVFCQRNNGLSTEGLALFSVKKIQHHTKKYHDHLVKSGSRKSVRRFIFKKGKPAAAKRRK